MCWWMTSCPSAAGGGRHPGSAMLSWSPSRLPRCFWGCPTTASSSRWRAIGSRICFPTCPSSRATTSGSAHSRHRSGAVSTTSPISRRPLATGCGCWTRPRSRADSRAKLTRRSEFCGYASYGYCRSHSRYFWGFRLYLLCAADGTPIAFELAAANAPEREVAQEMLERVPLDGYTIIADKGFAGREFEAFVADRGAHFLRPDRKDEPARFGKLGAVRQWIEFVFRDLQRPARTRTPRRPHAPRTRSAHRTQTARPHRRPLAQPPHR